MKSMKSTVARTNGDEVLNILSEQAPVGVCIMQDGKFRYVNSRFPIAIGYTVDELVGKDPLELIVPEDREMVMENEIKMLKGELLSPYQFRVIHKDGSIRWVMEVVRSVQYHGRRAVLGNYMEVTERKQMEEALKHSEENYRELASSITDVFFAMDEHLKYTYWNRASEILTGIQAVDAIGKSLSEIFPDTPGVRKAEKVYRKVLRTQQSQTFVSDVDLGGRHYIFDISAYPSRGGISVFVRDITERKRAEKARREAEEEKSAFLEEAPVGIIHTDLKAKITYVNKRFESESGYSRVEITGKSGLQLDWFPAGTTTYLAKRMAARLKGSPAEHWETQFKCKDGRLIWIELEGKILRRLGVPVGFQIIAMNITELKRAEETLQAEKNKLQSLIDAMEDGLTIQDKDYKIIYESGLQRTIFGDRVGEKCYRVYEGREKVCEGCPVKRAFKDGKSHTAERRTVMPSEEVTFWENTANPIRDANGDIVSCLEISRNITERKKQEQALADELTRRRLLVDKSLDGIVVLDVDAKVVEANQRFAEMLGYTLEEVRELHTWDWDKNFPPEKILEMGRNVDEKGLQLETKHTRKDGSVIDADISINAAMLGEQKLIFCVCRDITEHKQAVEALRQSEERYRTILEEMEDAYFEVDLGGHFTFVNNSVCRDLGYSREELMGMSYKKITVEEDIESVFRIFNEVYQSGLPNKGFPWITIRKDGSHGFAETSVSTLRNDKHEIIGFRGVGRDITERRRVEEALRQSEENYRALFDSLVIGTFVLDAQTMKVVMANRAGAKIFGLASTEEVVGTSLLDFISPEDKESVLGIIVKELFEQDLRRTHELQAIAKDGRRIWVSITGARIMHGDKLAGLISFADITEQKRQNERLMMTDRLASVGELAAGAAHELNNPLTSIIGFSELLMERDAPDYIRRDLALIRNEAKRAANVTSNLLTFARKHTPVKQLTQINDIIEDVLKLRAYAHKSNCIEVERHLGPDLPEIPIDGFQMQQAFLNIVINAEYFMTQAHKKGTLIITTKRQNDSVRVSFTDDGPGIPPENLGRIFDPFFTTKEAGKGTGLGLSICHGTVAEHDGQIYATSRPDKGATISIELPINGSNHVEVMP